MFAVKCSSALQLSSVAEDSVDLIVTSPPYNLGVEYRSNSDALPYEEYLRFSEQWIQNCYRWSKDTGRLCINVPLDKHKCGKHSVGADITQVAKTAGWRYQMTIIWHKHNITKRTAWGSWLSASAPCVIAPVELIIVLYKNVWKKANRGISDISKEEFLAWTNGLWTFNGQNAKQVGHPAPFPRELPKRCIKLFSFIGDTVLDPFSGSGTTLIEALKNRRKAYGLEIDTEYIRMSEKRIEAECNG